MPLTEWTPFRQLARAYASLLSIPAAASELARIRLSIGDLAEVQHTLVQQRDENDGGSAERMLMRSALGLRLLLDRTSLVDRHILEDGDWERPQLDYMAYLTEKLRGKGRTLFLDIGSYWGLYSLLAYKSCAFDRQIAIEADRNNFAQLQTNLLLNGAAKAVACINKAASNSNSDLLFMDSAQHPEGNRAGAGVLPPDSAIPSYVVPATTVDSAVNERGAYILAKIDVEGFEAYVLQGMANTVRENRVVLQIEIFDEHKDAAEPIIRALGLRQIHSIAPDYYLTNMTDEELGV